MFNFAYQMFPFWLLGAAIFTATYASSNRDVLRVNWGAVSAWSAFVLFLTAVRIFYIRATCSPIEIALLVHAISWIPLWSTLFVPWEDLAHTVPVAIADRYLSNKCLTQVTRALVILAMMASFGAGHIYQGVLSALFLSFYIPITLLIGRRFGFGTVMICHVVYDLCTVALIKYLI